MKKRIMSLVLAFVMVFTTVITGIQVQAEETDTTTAWTEPAKNEEGTYEIKTAEEMAWLAEAVNGKTFSAPISVKLMNDIDLSTVCGPGKGSWGPIGKYEYKAYSCFAGTFDGQGYTISNLYIGNEESITKNADMGRYIGLFGYTVDSTIKNVTVTGSITTGGIYVGGVVGYLSNGTVENCHSDIDITITGRDDNYGAAGITSALRTDYIGVTPEEETDNGKEVGTCKIINCSNSGTIDAGQRGAGGIVGTIYDHSVMKPDEGEPTPEIKPAIISGCVNRGAIYSEVSAGGIVSVTSGSTNVQFTDCYNVGTILAEKQEASIGGIVGKLKYDSANVHLYVSIKTSMTNCYNAGKIIPYSEADDTAGAMVGVVASEKVIGEKSGVYYLDTSASKDTIGAVAKTSDELKATDMVTALGEGYKADTGFNYGYPILSWEEGEYVAVSEVTLDKTEAVFLTDATLKLEATVKPANVSYPEVTWTSSNEEVATVDRRGLVTPVNPGEAVITATVDGKSASCNVTIKPVIYVESVTLETKELNLLENATASLTATVAPADASYPEITWSSSNEATVMVTQNGRLLAYKPGTAVITAKAEEMTAQCVVNVMPEDGTVESYINGTHDPSWVFSSITYGENNTRLLDITEKMTNTWDGAKPLYQVVVPEGVETVKVTFPSGYPARGFYSTPAGTYDVASGNADVYTSAEGAVLTNNEDGTSVIEITIANYTDTGTGICFKDNWWYLACGFDFVKGNPVSAEDAVATGMAKINAKAELEEYVETKNKDDYREAQQEELEKVLKAGKVAIDEATGDVAEALEAQKAALDEIKTDAQLLVEEKEAAKAALDEYVASKDEYDYQETQWAELLKAVEEAKKAIDETDSTEAANKALVEGKKAVAAVKTIAILSAEEAKAAAEEAKKEAEEGQAAEAIAKVEELKKVVTLTVSSSETVTVTAKSTKNIVATWSAVENADNYMVEILRNGKVVDTINTTELTYTYTGGKAGYAYTVVVTPTITYDGKVYGGEENEATAITKPTKPSIKVKKSGSKFKVTAKKRVCTGYQIQVSKKKNFKSGVKKYTVTTKKLAKSIKLSTLKKGKNYVRVRAYTEYNGNTVYSKWSAKKTVKK